MVLLLILEIEEKGQDRGSRCHSNIGKSVYYQPEERHPGEKNQNDVGLAGCRKVISLNVEEEKL